MSTVVLIVGEGLLADLVCTKLENKYQVIRYDNLEAKLPSAVDFALLLHDAWYPLVHYRAEMVFRSAGIPWLRGFAAFGEGVVGPLVRPGKIGCSRCADTRRLMAERDRKEMWELQQRMMLTNTESLTDTWASRTGLLHVAHLVLAEVQRVLQDGKPQLNGKMYFTNLKTLKTAHHNFLPDPKCSVCGQLPQDSPIAANISLRPSLKVSADSFRCRPLEELKRVLAKDYLDYRAGCLNGKMQDLVSPFASVSVNLPFIMGNEGTAGRTHSYAESEMAAILEGLERYCGLAPTGKQTVVYDSFNHLKDRELNILNPLQVGVHAKEQYAMPDFPFKAFDPDGAMAWVWGYSMINECPILVPELLAYYSLGCGDGFVYETSNGCAVGGSLEEAIFYGIMEVVERDSFLLTWYARLPLPRLDLNSANDKELSLMIKRLQVVAGYDVYAYNATMENGIPSVWTVAKNRRKQGVNLICAAGAHLDPIRAVKSAIHELAGMMLTLDEKFAENQDKYLRMLNDSTQVQQMEDHSMLYSLPQAEERLGFLLNENRPLRPFHDEFKWQTTHADLTDDLKDILQVFRRLKLDVIVVNQTAPELLRNGLHCVKVLIPGMLPMTFGHHLTRLEGLERVLRVPFALGYVQQPLTHEQLNSHPHPFP